MRSSDWSSDVCSSDLAGDDDVSEQRERRADTHCRAPHRRDQRDLQVPDCPDKRVVVMFENASAVRQGVGVTHHIGEIGPRTKSRSEEHTSELQSLMRISYAVFCLTKKNRRYDKKESVREIIKEHE